MAIKLKGIVAYPGKHRDEVVTAEMLKKAIQYQNRIPIIIGPHPPGGYAKPSDWVGTTTTIWNDEKQRVEGEFWLFDEDYDRLPDEIKRKIANREEIKLSAGYETDVVNGVQKWRKWDHLALGVPNPAIQGVGVNVRMEESELPAGFRSESEPVIPGEKKEESNVTLTKAELKALVDVAVKEAVQKAAEMRVPDRVLETEIAPEEVEDMTRPEPEPEMVLPASAPKSKRADDGIETTDDGWWKF